MFSYLPRPSSITSRMTKGALITLLALLSSACVSMHRVDAKPEFRQSLTEVTLLEAINPQAHILMGAPGVLETSGISVRGKLAVAVAAGVEISQLQSQSAALTAAIQPHAPQLGVMLTDEIEKQLVARGVKVTRIAIPDRSIMRQMDYTSLNIATPYVLEISLATGYQQIEGLYAPFVNSHVRLVNKSGRDVLYRDTIAYTESDANPNATTMQTDIKYVFENLESLYANGKIAAEGLSTGVKQVATKVVQQLK
jgi:hypothetical protein